MKKRLHFLQAWKWKVLYLKIFWRFLEKQFRFTCYNVIMELEDKIQISPCTYMRNQLHNILIL